MPCLFCQCVYALGIGGEGLVGDEVRSWVCIYFIECGSYSNSEIPILFIVPAVVGFALWNLTSLVHLNQSQHLFNHNGPNDSCSFLVSLFLPWGFVWTANREGHTVCLFFEMVTACKISRFVGLERKNERTVSFRNIYRNRKACRTHRCMNSIQILVAITKSQLLWRNTTVSRMKS